MTRTPLIMVSLLAAAVIPLSTTSDADAQGRGRGGPPPAAYDACEDKAEGDACEFDCRRGHVEGTCQVRWDDELSCVPNDRGPRGPRRGR
jgi:hypothetical protein